MNQSLALAGSFHAFSLRCFIGRGGEGNIYQDLVETANSLSYLVGPKAP